MRSLMFWFRMRHQPFWVVHHMTGQPRKPATCDQVGALSDNAGLMGFFEPATKHQPENPVEEFLLDVCEELRGWDPMVCLHVEVGKLAIDLQETMSIYLARVEHKKPLGYMQRGGQRVNLASTGGTLIRSQKTCKSATWMLGRIV